MKIELIKDKPIYDDLVNNASLFQKAITEKDIIELPDWHDNSDYSHVISLDKFLEKDFSAEDMEKAHIVSVPIDAIWSSEKSQGGFDRPMWTVATGIKKCKDNLNIPNGNGEPKGYKEEDAGILEGIFRPKMKNGKLVWILVKYIGNNRILMKQLANKGKVTNVLMSIRFHKLEKEGVKLKQKDYIQNEAERHTTDAGDRSGQNEQQKFFSSYRAGRKNAEFCFKFLRENKLNYEDIMQLELNGHEKEECKNWLSIGSLNGLKDGDGNGFFKKFGVDNVKAAIGTVRKIAGVTKETVVGSSSIEALSIMFKCFTEYGKTKDAKNAMFEKNELQDFFVKVFKRENRTDKIDEFSDLEGPKEGNDKWDLKKLSATGGVKDLVYINASLFWPLLPNYWSSINNSKTTFSKDCYAVEQFLKKSNDKNLKRDILNKVS